MPPQNPLFPGQPVGQPVPPLPSSPVPQPPVTLPQAPPRPIPQQMPSLAPQQVAPLPVPPQPIPPRPQPVAQIPVFPAAPQPLAAAPRLTPPAPLPQVPDRPLSPVPQPPVPVTPPAWAPQPPVAHVAPQAISQPPVIPNVPTKPVVPAGGDEASPVVTKRKKKPVLFIVLAAITVVLLAGGAFAASKFLGGIKLETYSNSSFSISYPKGYEVNESADGTTTFKEPKQPEDTQSGVVVGINHVPKGIDKAERGKVFKSIEASLEDLETFKDDGQKVINVDKEIIQFEAADALKIHAEIEKDGKKIGEVSLLAGVTEKYVYTAIAYGHISDPGVLKKIETIIQSFDLK